MNKNKELLPYYLIAKEALNYDSDTGIIKLRLGILALIIEIPRKQRNVLGYIRYRWVVKLCYVIY